MLELLHRGHDRERFDCGKDLLTNYLKYQASQDVKRKLAACFVLADSNSGRIKGYYTLSNSSIPLSSFPESIRKKLPPSYNLIPTTLLGRLAIDLQDQGKGIGKVLLVDALKRCYEISKELGSFAVVVDPIDSEAIEFYRKYGFILLPDSGKMFIAIKTLEGLFD
jgi:GNAT superfamily N-acetyltransferase